MKSKIIYLVNKIFLILIIFCSSLVFSQNKKLEDYYDLKTIKVKNDTINFIKISNKDDKNHLKSTVIFVVGSKPSPLILNVNDEKESYQSFYLPFNPYKYLDKFNFILIKRKGCPLNFDYDKINELTEKKPSDIYIQNDHLDYRVFQVNEVIKYIKKNKKEFFNNLYVIGHSEGYYITTKVAETNKNIDKIVCLSAHPFSRSCEFVFKNSAENYYKTDDKKRIETMEEEINYYKHIRKNPKEDYNFYAFNNYLSIKSLEKIKIPIFIGFGSNDIAPSLNLFIPYILPNKENITIKPYPDLDHNFINTTYDENGNVLKESFHWDDVFKDIVDWLIK
jgi:esterase/lipase